MSRAEARRRLQKADPNLTIIPGRRFPYAIRNTRIPKLLSQKEAEWLGLGEMFPVIVPEQNLRIQAKWAKIALQNMCWEFYIDPRGADKQALVDLLVWAGILDEKGDRTDKQPRKRE